MLKRLFFLLLTSAVSQLSLAQSIDDIKIPKIVPPSPDAAALGKYGQIPVDKSTGIPSISIPLYEIKTPRFSLPISLSYHASGIKVDELASWVGAGWSLNAGGMITRSIVGMADDVSPRGYLCNTIKKASEIQWPADMSYVAEVLNHRIDTDPDNFFYNFNNHSGAFVFGDDKKPVLMPYKPINIKYNLNTSTFASASNNFNITDENGDLYYFKTQENVQSSMGTYMSGISTWYLTMMVSADYSDTLSFVYTTDAAQLVDNSYGFTQSMEQSNMNVGESGTLQGVELNYSWRLFYPVRIQSIVFNGGKVDFIAKGGRLDNGNNSLDSVVVSNQDPATKKYKRIRSFKLVTDYFYAGSNLLNDYDRYPIPDTDAHRLKLTGVQEIGADHVVIKSHQFEYNTTTLPYVHSFAQDRWGYFNGNKGNRSLLESQTDILGSSFVKIGMVYHGAGNIADDYGADRSASPADMQAGVLNKITYPTGGNTTLTYDCNKSMGTVTNTYPVSAFAQGWDINNNNVVVNYTPTAHMLESGGNIFHVTVQGVKDLLPFPYVKVMDSSGGEVWSSIGLVSSSNLYYDGTITLQLNADVHYQLIAFAQGGGTPNTSNPITFSSISTSYQVTTPAVVNMGGLRVSSIKNFNADGSIASTETYAYGNNTYGDNNESGIGVQFAFPPVYKYIKKAAFWMGGAMCVMDTRTRTVYSNSSIYPLSTFSGSPIAYPTVTLYHGDGSLNTGKSVYQYDIYPDSIAAIAGMNINLVKPISMMWKNGEPKSESHYRNNGNNQYTLVQQINNEFDFIWKKKGVGTTVGFFADPLNFTFDTPYLGTDGQAYSSPLDCDEPTLLVWPQTSFSWYDYPISSGIRVLKSSTNSQVATDGASGMGTTTNYIYDNPTHLFPTRIITTNSKGETITKKINYPQDMVAAAGKDPTGIYSTMVAANIISPAIEQYKSKNGTQLLYEKTNYDVFNSYMFKPKSVELQTLSNPSEVRLQYLDYDSKGNLGTVVKDTGPKIGYQWGCNKKYPVAEVVNAASNEFYYEGFEEKNATTQVAPAHSGQYYYAGASYTVNWSLPNTRTYVISYWYLIGGVWTYMAEQNFTGSFPLNNGSGYDDIRVYPKDAQMKTYTHTPLLGITSETDAGNQTNTYYQYDNDGRLKNIRDKDNNIVKTFQYNYQQH